MDIPVARLATGDLPGYDESWSPLLSESADVQAVTNAYGVYQYVSPACRRVFGWRADQLEGRREDDLVDPDDQQTVQAARQALAQAPNEPVMSSYRFRCRDGSYRWVESNSHRVASHVGVISIITTLRDITERQQQNEVLQQQATTDPLTGVANRTVLLDRLQQGLQRLDRRPGLIVLLGLDLDRFKVVNDSLGHAVGDAVLLALAERLQRHLRPTDTLARLGGDEFAIVVEGLTEETEINELVTRLVESGREPFVVDGQPFECTLSIGVASTADPRHDLHELMRQADLALYRAKDQGRDRAEHFDHELRAKALRRLSTGRLLRRAVHEHRLVVEYQPILRLPDRAVVGVEAMIRLRDDDRELIPPDTFREVAEETGLMVPLDEEVRAEAIGHAKDWCERSGFAGFAVATKVTARQLADAGFPRSLLEALAEASLVPHRLQLEVTEHVLLEASHSAMQALRELQDAGIQVGLDDFGTGYSSLTCVQRFPLDYLKVDSGLVSVLDTDPAALAMVAATVSIAAAMHMTVVADGVETARQLEALELLGCDRAQGSLLSPALGPTDLGAYLDAHAPSGRHP